VILIRDLETKKTRIETEAISKSDLFLESEIQSFGLKPTTIPVNAFKKIYNGDFEKDIFPLYQTKQVNNFQNANQQYKELLTIFQDRSIENQPIREKIPNTIKKIFDGMKDKIYKPNLYLQKLTYKLEVGEDSDKIYNTLKNQDSNAMFKTLKINDDNTISVYSSTFGLWDINGNKYFKHIESGGKTTIRNTINVRKLDDLDRDLKDIRRTNFAIYEDANSLLKNKVIDGMRVLSETIHGERLSPVYRYYHLKENLTEEDRKQFEIDISVQEQVLKEKTHVGKKDTIRSEVRDVISQNEHKPHIQYYLHNAHKKAIIQESEILEKKELAIQQFESQRLEALMVKQKQELEKLKLDIQRSKIELPEAKEQFYKALKNGANFDEAIDMVKSNKYNEITIESVLQDVKSELILSKLKDVKIDTISTERDVYIADSRELKLQIYELKENLSQKIKTIEDKKSIIEIFKEKNKNLEKDALVSRELIQVYKDILISLKEELKELQKEHKESVEEYEEMLKNSEEEINSLSAIIKQNNETIKMLKEEASKYKETISHLEIGEMNNNKK